MCENFVEPDNSTATCTNDTSTDTVTCTIECHDGFDFDIAPMDAYTCGPETFHEWNLRTTFNPDMRLPSCVRTCFYLLIDLIKQTTHFVTIVIGTHSITLTSLYNSTKTVLLKLRFLVFSNCSSKGHHGVVQGSVSGPVLFRRLLQSTCTDGNPAARGADSRQSDVCGARLVSRVGAYRH